MILEPNAISVRSSSGITVVRITTSKMKKDNDNNEKSRETLNDKKEYYARVVDDAI